jgi:glycosyltransferase involved in cell wall biosynthesis
MNILMLGRWLPPARRLVRDTREYQFGRYLARDHHLTVAFVTDNSDTTGAISALRKEFTDIEFAVMPRTWKSLEAALRAATGESCTLSYARSGALRTRLEDRIRRSAYDLVFVLSSSMIQYVLDLNASIPVVMDFAGVDSEWWLAQAAGSPYPAARFFNAEASRLRLAEAAVARRAAWCVTDSSPADAIVRSLAPGGKTAIIPSGVDLEFFAGQTRESKTRTVVLRTSSLASEQDFREAEQFCRQVIPRVRARIAEARVVLASGEPIPNGRAARLLGAEVIGPVTDPRQFFHSQAVAVALQGTGSDLRRRALEPMAAGIPVVVGAKAIDRLGIQDKEAICRADGWSDVAQALIQLLEDPIQRIEFGQRGKTYVTANASWTVMAEKMAEIIERAAPGAPGAVRPAVKKTNGRPWSASPPSAVEGGR